jgi:hypothetical protein
VETAALSLLSSDAGDGARQPAQFESLRDALRGTPGLPGGEALEEEGQALVRALALLVAGAETDFAVRNAGCNSLTTLAKSRAGVRLQVVESLGLLVDRQPPPQVAQTVKESLKVLLKAAAPTAQSLDSPVVLQISKALLQLGAGEFLEKVTAPLRRKKALEEAQQEDIRVRRAPPLLSPAAC